MKRRSFMLFGTIALCFLFLLGACQKNAPSTDLSSDEISKLNDSETYPDVPGSLEKVFTSMDEIRADAQVIVEVEVMKSDIVPLDGMPQTHTKVKVSNVLKGNVAAGDTLNIVEEGGFNGKLIGDIPKMQAGENYFLHLVEYKDNYYISGAFQGRFIVKEGYVFQQATEEIKLTSYQPLKVDAFIDTYTVK